MKLKIIVSSLFLLFYSFVFVTSTSITNGRINSELSKQIQALHNVYALTKHYFLTDAASIEENLKANDKVMKLLEEAYYGSEKQRDIIRAKIYKQLKPWYDRMKKRGILQFHFVFPNNVSFLRMHKPDKYGDDLTNIRYSFAYANKNLRSIEGFEQGRVTHAFRYVTPLFGKNKKHIGAVEISLASYDIQNKLQDVAKIHSHFLVNKKVFNVKAWEPKDLIQEYIPSIEHPDYL